MFTKLDIYKNKILYHYCVYILSREIRKPMGWVMGGMLDNMLGHGSMKYDPWPTLFMGVPGKKNFVLKKYNSEPAQMSKSCKNGIRGRSQKKSFYKNKISEPSPTPQIMQRLEF